MYSGKNMDLAGWGLLSSLMGSSEPVASLLWELMPGSVFLQAAVSVQQEDASPGPARRGVPQCPFLPTLQTLESKGHRQWVGRLVPSEAI